MTAFADSDYPAFPYPGARPGCSFVHVDSTCWPLLPSWRIAATGADLDDWLAGRAAPLLADRVPVLTYGSNASPGKIAWMRAARGLTGPVVVLRARCIGLAAVWAAGLRVVDDQRPATLAAVPDVVEEHAVWLADRDQVRVLDVVEGRGVRYHLSRVASGRVELADGTVWDRPLAYTGASPIRWPLLVSGVPVRCADLPQAEAQPLVGEAGPVSGLTVSVVPGDPDPADFPDRLFVYGTLQPGGSAWSLAKEVVVGEPVRATLSGSLYDTGLGYPAMQLGGGDVAGWVLRLGEPGPALAAMDAYEGPEYRRVRVTLPGGAVCWTYVWLGPVTAMRRLTGSW